MNLDSWILPVRMLAFSQLFLTLGQGLRGARSSRAAGYLALFALMVAGYLANESTYKQLQFPLGLRLVFITMGALSPWAFWLWTKSWFEADFRFKRWYGLVPLLTALWVAAGPVLGFSSWWEQGLNLAALYFFSRAGLLLARDWRSDLLEPRRKARLALLGLMIALALLVLVGKSAEHLLSARLAPNFQLLGTAAIALVAGAANLLLFDLGPLFGLPPQPASPSVSPESERALAQLNRLMEQEQLFCTPGLTIGDLARRLELPEYKLRRLINGVLGFDNFNSYLNRYRVQKAAEMLAERAESILDVALAVGFNSLPPFNRAFRARFGQSPSQYRKNGSVDS